MNWIKKGAALLLIISLSGILIFAISVKGILKKQGINYEETEAVAGH
jgi:hypothetical protein